MRTTISIQDTLLQQVKEAALQQNCSMGEVIEDALRAALSSRPKSKGRGKPRPFKTYCGNGVQPGVDLGSSSALAEVMEER